MSTTSAMYQNTGNKSYAPRESPRIGSERTGSARTGSTHSHVNSLQAEETFSDYQVDYEPETHSGTHSADFCVTEEKTERTTDYRSGSTTVRSKLSAHSDGKSFEATNYHYSNSLAIKVTEFKILFFNSKQQFL